VEESMEREDGGGKYWDNPGRTGNVVTETYLYL
jgi:hypothetical protein